MSAATGLIDSKRKDADYSFLPVAASNTVWDGTFVFTRGDGNAYPGRAGTPGDIFVGVAYGCIFPLPTGVTATAGGTPATAQVKVCKTGSFLFGGSGFSASTDIGAKVYALDDNNVTKTSTNNVFVGYIQEVLSATSVRVRINLAVQ